MSTFVLVHGAWHGGWCWKEVKNILEEKFHKVYTPTMTGLGEREHLLCNNITMHTLVKDITNIIIYEDLNDVILVGHSFGGAIISGVAEAVPNKIKQMVYLDAAILKDGESMFDCMPPEIAEERKKLAQETSNGLSLPIPIAKDLGILDDKQWEFVKRNITPHPLSSYDTPIKLKNKPGYNLDCTYIICSNPPYLPLEWARKRAKKLQWDIIEINTGHDAMVTDPSLLVNTLLNLEK